MEAGTEVAEVCKRVLALRLGLASQKARRGWLVSRREEGAWRRAGASEPAHWGGTASPSSRAEGLTGCSHLAWDKATCSGATPKAPCGTPLTARANRLGPPRRPSEPIQSVSARSHTLHNSTDCPAPTPGSLRNHCEVITSDGSSERALIN